MRERTHKGDEACFLFMLSRAYFPYGVMTCYQYTSRQDTRPDDKKHWDPFTPTVS